MIIRIKESITKYLLKIKNKILDKGLLYTILYLLLYALKKIFGLLIYKRKTKEDDIQSKQWIFKEWENQWNIDSELREKDKFYKLFKYDYVDTCKKIRKNKRNNFRMKFISMLPLVTIILLFLTGVVMYNGSILLKTKDLGEFFKKSNWSFSIFNTILYAVAIILTVVVAKWIDVKQYQETWIRHSNHKYYIDMEMYKFIEKMDEYSDIERKENFKRNIMKTWDKNQNKFSENMKNERNVGEILKSMKK